MTNGNPLVAGVEARGTWEAALAIARPTFNRDSDKGGSLDGGSLPKRKKRRFRVGAAPWLRPKIAEEDWQSHEK